MIERAAARDLAAQELSTGLQISDTGTQELLTGWFFPFRGLDPNPLNWPIGVAGVIVNKQTGARLVLGSGVHLKQALAFYDKGYQFDRYALVVIEISAMERTLDTLEALRIHITEPFYEYGTVWRIPRPLTRAELQSRLTRLPCVFDRLDLNSCAEALEQARGKGYFQFALHGWHYPPTPR